MTTTRGAICALCIGILMAAAPKPSFAKDPAPFPEFSAKRVKPPKAGNRKRITIQIDPAAQQAPAPKTAAEKKSGPKKPVQGRYAWFWEKVSPTGPDAVPGRVAQAMSVLAGAKAPVAAPRLQHLQNIAKAHGVDILRSTIGTKVSPALALAVISVESSGKTDAKSTAGASGLMQLMPATAARFGVEDSLIPAQNIAGGVKYLDWLMGEFGGDAVLVLAGYNAGEGAVRKHAGVPPFAETRDYVPKVLAAFQVAKGLCLTPPELVSDGCVFAAMD